MKKFVLIPNIKYEPAPDNLKNGILFFIIIIYF